ncbi:hypothetical protein VP01_4055g1 [Puccinia sorghi]|uniref:Uncharacterized protein n=1 Tax=Puccinia sorghi TaxID=27349 RepID=A0A0L6URL6_9BASI|nr:hypothetical protein VP01_4055g1 [Puccinia sorghi]
MQRGTSELHMRQSNSGPTKKRARRSTSAMKKHKAPPKRKKLVNVRRNNDNCPNNSSKNCPSSAPTPAMTDKQGHQQTGTLPGVSVYPVPVYHVFFLFFYFFLFIFYLFYFILFFIFYFFCFMTAYFFPGVQPMCVCVWGGGPVKLRGFFVLIYVTCLCFCLLSLLPLFKKKQKLDLYCANICMNGWFLEFISYGIDTVGSTWQMGYVVIFFEAVIFVRVPFVLGSFWCKGRQVIAGKWGESQGNVHEFPQIPHFLKLPRCYPSRLSLMQPTRMLHGSLLGRSQSGKFQEKFSATLTVSVHSGPLLPSVKISVNIPKSSLTHELNSLVSLRLESLVNLQAAMSDFQLQTMLSACFLIRLQKHVRKAYVCVRCLLQGLMSAICATVQTPNLKYLRVSEVDPGPGTETRIFIPFSSSISIISLTQTHCRNRSANAVAEVTAVATECHRCNITTSTRVDTGRGALRSSELCMSCRPFFRQGEVRESSPQSLFFGYELYPAKLEESYLIVLESSCTLGCDRCAPQHSHVFSLSSVPPGDGSFSPPSLGISAGIA